MSTMKWKNKKPNLKMKESKSMRSSQKFRRNWRPKSSWGYFL